MQPPLYQNIKVLPEWLASSPAQTSHCGQPATSDHSDEDTDLFPDSREVLEMLHWWRTHIRGETGLAEDQPAEPTEDRHYLYTAPPLPHTCLVTLLLARSNFTRSRWNRATHLSSRAPLTHVNQPVIPVIAETRAVGHATVSQVTTISVTHASPIAQAHVRHVAETAGRLIIRRATPHCSR